MSELAVQELLSARARIDAALSALGYAPPKPFGSIGKIIESRRAELNMSLQDVADGCGMTKSYIWELAKERVNNPTLEAVWLLARSLHLDPIALVSAVIPSTLSPSQSTGGAA